MKLKKNNDLLVNRVKNYKSLNKKMWLIAVYLALLGTVFLVFPQLICISDTFLVIQLPQFWNE